MGKQKAKPNYRRRVLRLPDLDHCKSAVLLGAGFAPSLRVRHRPIHRLVLLRTPQATSIRRSDVRMMARAWNLPRIASGGSKRSAGSSLREHSQPLAQIPVPHSAGEEHHSFPVAATLALWELIVADHFLSAGSCFFLLLLLGWWYRPSESFSLLVQ